MTASLRPYQADAVEKLRGSYRAGYRAPVLVLPTGAGKTQCFTHIAESSARKGNSVLIVAHRRELIAQAGRKLSECGLRYGVIAPGRTPTTDPVQVGSVQTLDRRLEYLPKFDLIVLDEAHHCTAGQWKRLLESQAQAKILGVTACPQRLDSRGIGIASGGIFDALVTGPSMAELIDDGYLANFDYYAPPNQIDLSGVKTRMGDFAVEQLASAMDKPTITGDAVQHFKKYALGRPGLAFCVNVDHTNHVSRQFAEAGLRSAVLTGTTPPALRDRTLAQIGAGELDILVSCDILTEGFDCPAASVAVLLRPTKSLNLYLQMVGRVLRLKPDGSRAVIIDHVNNVARHGTPRAPREWSLDAKRRKPREAAIRQCNVCFMAFDQGEKAQCESDNPKCLFAVHEAAPRELIETVAGELMQVSETPEWAGGVNIVRAKGDEWRTLLAHARTREQLQEIAKARGFRPGWIFHIERQRAGRPA